MLGLVIVVTRARSGSADPDWNGLRKTSPTSL
jgi:hypothetical protein